MSSLPSVPARPTAGPGRIPVVRLGRHRIRTTSGRMVGVAMAGTGMPLVVAHGFAAQGALYAQTLSRLVSMGFMVVAVDVAGHGRTPAPPFPALRLSAYRDEFAAAVDALGIRRAVFMGHSMGGRIVTELAAERTDATVALVLVDPVVGWDWDRQIAHLRHNPLDGAGLAFRLASDTASLVDPHDLSQTAKILSLLVRTSLSSLTPRLLAPAAALIGAEPSAPVLMKLAAAGVPALVIHGALDRPVPLAGARQAAADLRADLVVVEGARHSWLLSDPEALPGIFGQLLKGRLGDAWTVALEHAGLDPAVATLDQIEAAMLAPNSLAARLSNRVEYVNISTRRPSRYAWRLETPPPRLRRVV
ncbi:MAG: alpha/beta fold hydrolase [Acidimicrobiales bacterium]